MSRNYEMRVSVEGHEQRNSEAIVARLHEFWNFDVIDHLEYIDGIGTGQLFSGYSVGEFATDLATAIFQANGGCGNCTVSVGALFLDEPTSSFEFSRDKLPDDYIEPKNVN